MIELNSRHPFEAALSFAIEWLSALAERDFVKLDALVEARPNPVDFPNRPNVYAHDFGTAWPLHPNKSDEYDNWVFRLQGQTKEFHLAFEVPFPEEDFRPLLARFDLYQDGPRYLVEFVGFFYQ